MVLDLSFVLIDTNDDNRLYQNHRTMNVSVTNDVASKNGSDQGDSYFEDYE